MKIEMTELPFGQIKASVQNIEKALGITPGALWASLEAKFDGISVLGIRNDAGSIVGAAATVPAVTGSHLLVAYFQTPEMLRGVREYFADGKRSGANAKKHLEETVNRIVASDSWLEDEIRDLRDLDTVFGIFGDREPQLYKNFLHVISQQVRLHAPDAKEAELQSAMGQEFVAIKDAIDQVIKGVSEPLRKHADPEAFKLLDLAPAVSPAAYAFYATRHEDKRLNRHQAAEANRFLAAKFPGVFRIRNAIDRRENLTDAIAGTMQIGSKALKRFRKIEWSPGNRDLDRLVRCMLDIDGNWMPATDREWKAFLEVSDLLHGKLMQYSGQGDAAGLYAGCKGKWEEFALRLRKAAGIVGEDGKPDPEAIGDGALNVYATAIENAVEDLSNRLVVPMAALLAFGGADTVNFSTDHMASIRRFASNMMFQDMAAAETLDRVRRFQLHRLALMGSVVSVQDQRSPQSFWPPLIGNMQTPDGVKVTELVTPGELEREGREMNHCVGGYSRTCIAGTSRILHMEDSDGKTSTLEISITRNGATTFHNRQNWAYGNKKCSVPLQKAAKWLLDGLNVGAIKTDLEAIASHARLARTHVATDPIHSACGYDWLKIENAKDIFEKGWGDFMSGPFKMSFDDLIKSEAFVNLIKEINPHADLAYNMTRPTMRAAF